jgi:hypothetical protein
MPPPGWRIWDMKDPEDMMKTVEVEAAEAEAGCVDNHKQRPNNEFVERNE